MSDVKGAGTPVPAAKLQGVKPVRGLITVALGAALFFGLPALIPAPGATTFFGQAGPPKPAAKAPAASKPAAPAPAPVPAAAAAPLRA